MAWTEKARPTPVETNPIPGLFLIDGDFVERTRRTPWSQGKKRSTIVFPSGAHCDVLDDPVPGNVAVHIFDALAVPLIDTDSQALADARETAEEHWYLIDAIDNNHFVVTGEAESATISYDPATRQLIDVLFLRDGVPVPYAVCDILNDFSRDKLPTTVPPEPLALTTIAPVRYALRDTDWTWYATAFDGQDTLFGLAVEETITCTSFSVTDLARLRGPLGYSVEYDYDFWPETLGDMKAKHERLRNEQRLFTAVPTNWVAKEDLLSIRPDLASQIGMLDDNDLAEIADKVGDALSESYWIALPIILASYLGVPELDDDVDDMPPDEPYRGPHWDWETEAQRDLDRLPPLVRGPDGTYKPQRSDTETQKSDDAPDMPTTPA